jgi:hypothetical protein
VEEEYGKSVRILFVLSEAEIPLIACIGSILWIPLLVAVQRNLMVF